MTCVWWRWILFLNVLIVTQATVKHKSKWGISVCTICFSSLELFIRYRNEFRSRMKFVLHSHEIERVSLRRSHPHGLRARSDIRAPLAQDYRFCDFQSEQSFQVTSEHGTRMKFRTGKRISLEMKTGMNSFLNDLYGDELSSWYHVNRYKEIAWRWNELAPEWKPFWYYVSSPIEDPLSYITRDLWTLGLFWKFIDPIWRRFLFIRCYITRIYFNGESYSAQIDIFCWN